MMFGGSTRILAGVFFSTFLFTVVDRPEAEITFFNRWKPAENLITFRSDAPAELLIGRTRSISGELLIPDHAIAGASGEVVVETSSFSTGVELRDETIRSPGWLDAQAHPFARFTIRRLISKESVLGVSEPIEVEARGTLELRGIRQNVAVPTTLCYMPPHLLGDPDARLLVKGEFVLDIRHFGMEIPLHYTARINPEVVVTFDLTARAAGRDSRHSGQTSR